MHFLLDYETIGQNVFNIPVINCSCVMFDWNRFTSDNPYTFKGLLSEIKTFKVSIIDQVKNHKRSYKDSDLDWWQKQSHEVCKQLKPSVEDLTLKGYIDSIISYIGDIKVDYWWSRANSFDPVILQRDFNTVYPNRDLNDHLKFWNVRDVRTYIDTNFRFKLKRNTFCPYEDEEKWKEEFQTHNSAHDVAADILRLQMIERCINNEG